MAESVEKLARSATGTLGVLMTSRMDARVRLVSGALRWARLPGLKDRLSETATPRAPMMADMA